MAFIIVGRGSDSGTVSLITDEVYGTMKQAQKALGALPSKVVRAHRDDDVFVIDLDKATPVLLVGTGDDEEAEEVAEAAEAVEVEVTEGEAAEEGAGLASALKRAADTMEGEGITPPESVGPPQSRAKRRSPFPEIEAEEEKGPLVDQLAPEMMLGGALMEDGAMVTPAEGDTAWPWEESGTAPAASEEAGSEVAAEEPEPSADLLEPEAEVVAEEVAEAEVEPTSEAAAEEPPATEEPPASEEPAEAEAEPEAEGQPEAPAEQEPPGAEAELAELLDALERPAADVEDSMISTPEPDVLEAGGRAVIVGDYAGEAPADVIEAVGVAEPASVVAAEPASEVAPEMPVGSIDEPPADAGAPVESAYDCDDCVYVNTCPKAHDADPSQCGSFQFRPI